MAPLPMAAQITLTLALSHLGRGDDVAVGPPLSFGHFPRSAGETLIYFPC